MPVAKYQLSDGRIARFQVPAGTTPEQAQVIGQKFFTQAEPIQDVPVSEALIGGAEIAATIGSGIVGEIAGGVTGTATALIPGTAPGSGAGVAEEVSKAFTYQPRTEVGRRGLESFGKTLEPAGKAFELAEKKLGDIGYKIGGPVGGAIGETIPTAIGEALGVGLGKVIATKAKHANTKREIKDLINDDLNEDAPVEIQRLIDTLPKQSAKKEQIKALIKEGSTSKEVAAYRINQFNELKKDNTAKSAIDQGFDEGVIAAIKASSAKTKKSMLQSVNKFKAGKKSALQAIKNRPSDVVGDSLSSRVKSVMKSNKKAGQELDKVSQKLKGQEIDVSQPVSSFMSNLDSIGVNFDPNTQKLNFKGSDIEGLDGPQNIIKRVIKRMINTKAPDAFDVHRLKKFIDEQVTYGKSAEGLSGKSERIIKDLRRSLDESLDDSFPEYDAANTQYAETITVLDDFQKSVGGTINLTSPNVDKALGTVSRRLMSNAQSRVGLIDSLDEMQRVATKYGGKFNDDILTQVLFVDELERMFGATAKTSLQGDIQKTADRAARAVSQGLFATAVKVGAKGADVARGINEANAVKSIEKLLKQ